MNLIENQLQQKNKNEDLERLLKLGTKGHFPLFYPDWITKAFKKMPVFAKMPCNLKIAETRVNQVFDLISKYQNLDRQRTALLSLRENDREEFIMSFIHMVEARMMDEIKPLH